MSREVRRSSATGRFVGLASAAFACAVLVACSGDSTPPPELVGTWNTEAPDYADRAFTITDSTVTLHQGEGRSETHRIRAVRQETRSGWTDYALEYEKAGSRLTFGFQYFEPGEVRLRNLEHMVWRRKD